MFLITALSSIPVYVILIVVSVLLAVLGVFVHRKYVRTPQRIAKKARKQLVRANVKEAKKHRKERLRKQKEAAAADRTAKVQRKPKELPIGPKGKQTLRQRAATQKRKTLQTSSGDCGRRTQRGTACQQPRLRGKDHCQYHTSSTPFPGKAPRQKSPAATPKPSAPKVVTPKVQKPSAPKAQKSTTNVASSGFTPVQTGFVSSTPVKTPKPQPSSPSRSSNYAAPGAKVGQQASVINGNVNVTMAGRRVVTDKKVNSFSGDAFVTGKGNGFKAGKDKAPNSRDVDQSTSRTFVAGRKVSSDGTMNIVRNGD